MNTYDQGCGLIMIGGPQMTSRYKDDRVGACTDCRKFWTQFRAGKLDRTGIDAVEGRLVTTAGTCAVMGTASTMAAIAESLGTQAPTATIALAPALLAGVSGGGTALVELVAVVAMGFVAYAFVVFTRGFNSAGSVYGFTGAVAGPMFGSSLPGRSCWSMSASRAGLMRRRQPSPGPPSAR